MTTDTLTLPRRALTEGDDLAATSDREPIVSRPRRKKRGPWRLPRLSSSARTRGPAADHLLLVGPGGGPVWTSLRL